MEYQFKYKRRVISKTYKVMGHRYDDKTDKMVLFFQNGSVKEIPEWKSCHFSLGTDWVLAQKKYMEEQAGQTIPLKTVP